MFSHVFIGTTDFGRSLAFYAPLTSLLGIAQRFCDHNHPWAAWQMPGQARPLLLVGAPGLRPHYHADYYGAYIRDPDGNKLCVACHEET